VTTFYLDQNVSQRIVPFLQEIGHQAITTRSMHFERAGDDEQLFLAWQNGWIMVTHDGNDYLLLHTTLRRWASAWGVMGIHAGILILPYGFGEREQARRLDIFAASELVIANELYDWEEIGGWIRR
jgi:uncharacterized protein DUF5615